MPREVKDDKEARTFKTPEKPGLNLSRRKFLQITLPSLLGGALQLQNYTRVLASEPMQVTEKERRERLRRCGLACFGQYYEKADRLRNLFGVIPRPGQEVFGVCDKVVNGLLTAGNNKVREVSEGWCWRTLPEQVPIAEQHAAELQVGMVDLYAPDPLNSEAHRAMTNYLRSFLQDLAKVLPNFVLALPNKVNFQYWGGFTDISKNRDTAYTYLTNFYTTENGDNSRAALTTLIHEVDHNLNEYHIAKTVVGKEDFARYLTEYIDVIGTILVVWLRMNEDDAKKIKLGGFLLPARNSDVEIIHQIAQRFFPGVNMRRVDDEANHPNFYTPYYSRFAWKLGRVLIGEEESIVANGKKFTASELRKDLLVQSFMENIFYEIHHYLVGPVQDCTAGGWPTRWDQVDQSWLGQMNARLQRMRFDVFAGIDPKTPFDEVMKKIYDSLTTPRTFSWRDTK